MGNLQAEPENTMMRYLLGELPEAEMSALEARYFAEPKVFDQVLAAETKLLDDYARNRLPREMRTRFESGYMAHPVRRERVKFAGALAERLDAGEQPAPSLTWRQSLVAWFDNRRPALAFSIAAAAVLIVIGGMWIFNENRQRTSDKLAQTPAANNEVGRVEPLQDQPPLAPSEEPDPQPTQSDITPQPKPSVAPEFQTAPRTVSLVLALGGVRGSDTGRTPVLAIRRGTEQVRLSLTLKEIAYSSYRLSLQTISGQEIASRTIVKPKGANLVLTMPADKLSNGDHVLNLTGVAEDGEADDLSRSLFRVRKIN